MRIHAIDAIDMESRLTLAMGSSWFGIRIAIIHLIDEISSIAMDGIGMRVETPICYVLPENGLIGELHAKSYKDIYIKEVNIKIGISAGGRLLCKYGRLLNLVSSRQRKRGSYYLILHR